jgi:DNA primase
MAHRSDIRDIVESAIGDARPSTNGWYRANCPLCVTRSGVTDKKVSLGFRPDNGFFYCQRCGLKGFLQGDFHLMAEKVARAAAEADKPPQVLEKPEGLMGLWKEPAISAIVTRPARRYLIRKRGIRKLSVWREAQISVTLTDPYHANRIIVPIMSTDATQWVGWVARVWRQRQDVLPYRYPFGMKRGQLLFNHEALLVETNEPAVIVEGVFDALPYWPHGVACLGKPSRKQFPFLLAARRPLVVALDGDAWREGQALCRKLRFKGKQAEWIKLPPCTDPGDKQHAEDGELMEHARKAIGLT